MEAVSITHCTCLARGECLLRMCALEPFWHQNASLGGEESMAGITIAVSLSLSDG
jgi:hypothetical protein